MNEEAIEYQMLDWMHNGDSHEQILEQGKREFGDRSVAIFEQLFVLQDRIADRLKIML